MFIKLVLFIGPKLNANDIGYIYRNHRKYRHLFVADEILGLATAVIRRPDIIFCQSNLTLLSSGYIKYKLSNLNKDCSFFIVGSKQE